MFIVTIQPTVLRADPIGPYDLFFEPLPLTAIILVCLLSFFLEYILLKWMLKRPSRSSPDFRINFIKANALSFPIAWVVYFSLSLFGPVTLLLGLIAGESIAIIIEKRFYDPRIGLKELGWNAWWYVGIANLASWFVGVVLGVSLAVYAHDYSEHRIRGQHAAVFYDCLKKSLGPVEKDHSWVKSSKIVYGIDPEGRLYRTHLNSNDVEILSDANLSSASDIDIAISPDGTKIFSDGWYRSGRKTFLYDTVTNIDHDLSSGTGKLFPMEMSPNGRYVAWHAGFGQDQFLVRNGENAYSFVFVDAATKIVKRAKFPEISGRPLSLERAVWGPNGEILAGFIKPRVGVPADQVFEYKSYKNAISYYKLDLTSGRFDEIEGATDDPQGNAWYPTHFIENGQEIKIPPRPCPQSECVEAASTGSLKTDLGNGNLIVVRDDGQRVKIMGGCSEQSSGRSFAGRTDLYVLQFWPEGKKYLVFNIGLEFYIYDIEEKRISELPNLKGVFAWAPLTVRKQL